MFTVFAFFPHDTAGGIAAASALQLLNTEVLGLKDETTCHHPKMSFLKLQPIYDSPVMFDFCQFFLDRKRGGRRLLLRTHSLQ